MNQLFIGIQARLNSSRFPRKSLHLVAGIPLIVHVIQRLHQITHPHFTALLVPSNEANFFHKFLLQHQVEIPIFGGSENDVLSRYYHASKHFGFDKANNIIMRVTGDNPLISITLANLLIKNHFENHYDLSHHINNPLGSGVELITFQALEKSHIESTTTFQKEHLTQYIYQNPHLFSIGEIPSPYTEPSQKHLSIDTPKDLVYIEKLLSLDPEWDISKHNLIDS